MTNEEILSTKKLTSRFDPLYFDVNGTLSMTEYFDMKFRNCKFNVNQKNAFRAAICKENFGHLLEFLIKIYAPSI